MDPDPGDRDSVSSSDRQSHASLHVSTLSVKSVQYGRFPVLLSRMNPSVTDLLFYYSGCTAVTLAFSTTLF